MPARKSTKTRTSSRTRTSSQTRGPQRGNKKNPKKKQDNTKLFIGIGVGVFFFIFIIIAAASGGSDNAPQSSGSSLSADFLSLSQRKEIYSKYNQEYNAIEDDARSKLSNLSMEDRRTNGRTIQKIKGNQQAYLPNKMFNIYSDKYNGITLKYIRKYVIDAGDAQQW